MVTFFCLTRFRVSEAGVETTKGNAGEKDPLSKMAMTCTAVVMMMSRKPNKRKHKLKVGYGGAHAQLLQSVLHCDVCVNRLLESLRFLARLTQP